MVFKKIKNLESDDGYSKNAPCALNQTYLHCITIYIFYTVNRNMLIEQLQSLVDMNMLLKTCMYIRN